MKKVAIIIDSLSGGGAEKVMLEVAKGITKRGTQVKIFIRKKRIEHTIPEKIEIICLDDIKPKQRMKRHDYAKLLKTTLQNEGPFELILSNLESTDKMVKLLKLSNVYYVIHNTISKKLENRYNKKGILNRMKHLREKIKFKILYKNENLITVSNGVKNDLLNTLHIKPKTIQTIYNPFDIKHIRKKSLENNSLIPKEPYIINVGRFLIEHKRQDLLLEAYKISNIKEKLVLMGQGEDKEKILQHIEKLNLEDKVILIEFQKNPYPFIKNAKLFVLSSDYEGLPTVLIESLITNTPIVSTNCKSGPAEILGEENKELLSPTNDANLLAKNIINSLKTDKIIRPIDIKKYSLDTITNNYLNLKEIK